MGQGQSDKLEGIPLKRSDGLILVMDTPKGTSQVELGNVKLDIAPLVNISASAK